MQGGGLADQPARHTGRRVPGTGQAGDAQAAHGQRHRYRLAGGRGGQRGVDRRGALGGELQVGGEVGEADPQPQRVGVVVAPLPEPPPGAGHGEQHLGGVGRGGAAGGLVVGAGALHGRLEDLQPRFVLLELLAVLLAAVPPVAPPLADHDQWRHEREQQEVRRFEGDGQAHPQRGGQEGGEQLQPHGLGPLGLGRDLEAPRAARRPEPGRPVVGQPAVGLCVQVGVGRFHRLEGEHGPAAAQQGVLGPGQRTLQGVAVQQGGRALPGFHGDGVRGEPDHRGPRGQPGVGHGHRAGGVGTDGVHTQAEAVHRAGGGPADHPDLHDSAGLLGQRGHREGAVEGDEVAVAEQAERGGRRVEGAAVHPERRWLGPGGVAIQPVRGLAARQPHHVARPLASLARQGLRDPCHRGRFVALDHDIAVGVLVEHGEHDPHRRSPRVRPRIHRTE